MKTNGPWAKITGFTGDRVQCMWGEPYGEIQASLSACSCMMLIFNGADMRYFGLYKQRTSVGFGSKQQDPRNAAVHPWKSPFIFGKNKKRGTLVLWCSGDVTVAVYAFRGTPVGGLSKDNIFCPSPNRYKYKLNWRFAYKLLQCI